MWFFDQRFLGIIILLLWAMLVVAKWLATGSLLRNRPQGGAWIWFIHLFNFFFLLVVNPLAAILLIVRPPQAHLIGLEPAGMLLCTAGYLLMAWALFTLRANYQVGGSAPRTSDALVTSGPYRFVRHPMYAAALFISLGLACLTHSLAFFCVFCIYVLLILMLIPVEEEGLRRAYGEPYAVYQAAVKRLVPSLF
ncbi:MAG TPA: isoprenylcysteine carboxylmethyltransferase family protein [Bryobacteraceae bacterium]|nr:isoprenylcysteine carboxylmethyltransferase family protein [Bryobacteraceae bacterium]HPT27401.1 isoprenylcysteine carboxylmethyltransferase family protein [Bryobacteraceae bacterium]